MWLGPLRGLTFHGHLSHRAGIYEIAVQKIFVEELKAGDVLYDVGANIGYLTLLGASLVGETGEVYAFEPFPENQDFVQRTISDNHLKNAHLERKAVSDSDGRATLSSFAGQTSTPSLLPYPSLDNGPEKSTIDVETISIDTFAACHRPPSFVKVDVEGAEAMVIAGATKTLSQNPAPRWLIELHNAEADAQITTALQAAGYDITRIVNSGAKKYPCHVMASKS